MKQIKIFLDQELERIQENVNNFAGGKNVLLIRMDVRGVKGVLNYIIQVVYEEDLNYS